VQIGDYTVSSRPKGYISTVVSSVGQLGWKVTLGTLRTRVVNNLPGTCRKKDPTLTLNFLPSPAWLWGSQDDRRSKMLVLLSGLAG
jgi:hypothetical protein